MVRENNENFIELTKHFQQDRRYSALSDIPDRKVHLGEPFELQLTPHFMDEVAMQEGEEFHPYDLRDVSDEENQRINNLFLEDKEREKRRIIRNRFPLRVRVVSGVLYSPALSVILESFGKIPNFIQTQIDPEAVYINYVRPPRRIVAPRQALRDAMHLNTQPLVEEDAGVQQFRGPLPLQLRPSTPFPPMDLEEDHSGSTYSNSQPGPSQTPAPLRRSYAEVAKTPRKSYEPAAKVVRGTSCPASRRLDFDDFDDVSPKTKSKITFEIFEDDCMGFAHDKDHSGVTSVTQNKRSLDVSIHRNANEKSMTVCNSVKVGHSMYGTGMCSITLFKTANFFSGHCVNFSLREAPSIVTAIMHSYYRGSQAVAQARLDEEYKKCEELEEQGMEEDAQALRGTAYDSFNRRMHVIAKAYHSFREDLEE